MVTSEDFNRRILDGRKKDGYTFMGDDSWHIDEEATIKYCLTSHCNESQCYRHSIIPESRGEAQCSYHSSFKEPKCIKTLVLDKELFTL